MKALDLNLVELFDQESHLNWRFPGEFDMGFLCNFVLEPFLSSPGHSFDLCLDDESNLAYLATISPRWLPISMLDDALFTHYAAHWVLRQFRLDQDVPLNLKDVLPTSPSLDPFLSLHAFHCWSQKSPQVVIPSSQRIGYSTSNQNNYWRRVMNSFRNFVGTSDRNVVPSANL